MVVHHVFPYDPGHLGLSVDAWWSGQLARWPLAAVRRSQRAADSIVHVIGNGWPSTGPLPGEGHPLRLVVHPTLYSNARHHAWGDDWSRSLGRALRATTADDIVIIHLEGYAAARLSLRAAHRARCVLVLHGRGTGSVLEHQAADISVVLNDEARAELRELGVPDAKLWAMTPSIDREVFLPAERSKGSLVGYVGRLEESKGAFELPAMMRALTDLPLTLECVGSSVTASDAERAASAFRDLPVELIGEVPAQEVAARMQRWSALVVPSFSEGMPLSALEALCCAVPVVGVEGVLPGSLTARRGVFVGPREEMADRVRLAVASPSRPDATGIPDHAAGGRAWDEVCRALPSWTRRPRPSARPQLGRLRRWHLAP